MRTAGFLLLIGLVASTSLQVSKDELRKKLKDEVHPSWIYDDMPSALAAGSRTGKPICAVFR